MRVAGKVAVITGAGSGIGRALAAELAARGARLLLADIDVARLDGVTDELRARGAEVLAQTVDTGTEQGPFELAASCALHFGAADLVINNAGVALVAPVRSLGAEDAHWLMNINFWGVVHGCRAFLPQLATRPEAMLVNLSSIFGMVSVPTQSLYNASKAAVRGFSDALREELRGGPVKVLCVHPGGIRTSIVRGARVVDLAGVADSVGQLAENFDRGARTSAERAARAIVRAIEADRTRVLIGADARILDALYRLAPSRASAWLTAFGRWARERQARARGARRHHH